MTTDCELRSDLAEGGKHGQSARFPYARLLLGLVILLAAAVYVLSIGWGLPPDGTRTWAGDEIRPGTVASYRLWEPLYPPAHRYLLGALLGGLDAARGWLSWEPDDWPTSQILASRCLTAVLASLSLLIIYRCGRLVLGRAESLLAVVCTGFGAAFVYYAKTANLDIPYLFWYVASMFFFLRCLGSRRLHEYVLFAVFGTLSIATKTQAYALFVLPAAALVLDLRKAQSPGERSLLRALLDRRILAAAGVTVALTLLLFGEFWGRGELLRHVQALTASPYDDYQAYVSAPALVLKVTLENLVLSLGLPVLVAALAGIVLAVRRPARNALLLHLLLFPLSYYPTFILATGFNYERHYLPITVVLGLFAGKALGAFLRVEWSPLWVRRGVVSLVILHVLLRGLSVDLVLRGDARYEAERWLVEQGLREQTRGLGSKRDLPRGIAAAAKGGFAKWRRGEHSYNPAVWHNCAALNRLEAEYLIPDFAENLAAPGLNYRQYRRFRNRAPWTVVDFGRFSTYHTTLAKLARDVVVFKRTDDECVDSGWVPRSLHELRQRRDEDLRRSLARGIFDSPVFKSVGIPRSDYRVVRAGGNFWTKGTLPAGVAVRNSGREPYTPKLTLGLAAAGVQFPISVLIEDGIETREERFDEPGLRTIRLSPVDPGDEQLYIVWTDRYWRDSRGGLRGVHLLAGETRGEWLNRLFEQQADTGLYETMSQLATLGEPQRRTALIDAILDESFDSTTRIEDSPAVMVGGWRDGWTYETLPAGLLVHNQSGRPARPKLRLGCDLPEEDRLLSLSIDDGSKIERVTLDCSNPRSLRLSKITAGGHRLYILRPDRPSMSTSRDDRSRGVLVKKVSLIEKGGRGAIKDPS